ncbi:MAG: methyltransferase domain-containing protein [Bryobacterales bacterium]|nr:methyltransferase domain-containing protein [Bryobacterales bacterium]
MTTAELQEKIAEIGPWFYSFSLPGGISTESKIPLEVQAIFETRRRMMESALREHFGPRLSGVRAVDVGCHEGYYALALRGMGVADVLGIDYREENLRRARFVAEQQRVSALRYLQADVEELNPASLGAFDLTLCFGLLYHLENPMRVLRRLHALTGEMLLLETQVVAEVEGVAEWGSREWTRPFQGILAVIDETGEYAQGNQETGSTPVVTCPSPKALRFLLHAAGFRDVTFLDPPPGAYEQLERRQRVIVKALR